MKSFKKYHLPLDDGTWTKQHMKQTKITIAVNYIVCKLYNKSFNIIFLYIILSYTCLKGNPSLPRHGRQQVPMSSRLSLLK